MQEEITSGRQPTLEDALWLLSHKTALNAVSQVWYRPLTATQIAQKGVASPARAYFHLKTAWQAGFLSHHNSPLVSVWHRPACYSALVEKVCLNFDVRKGNLDALIFGNSAEKIVSGIKLPTGHCEHTSNACLLNHYFDAKPDSLEENDVPALLNTDNMRLLTATSSAARSARELSKYVDLYRANTYRHIRCLLAIGLLEEVGINHRAERSESIYASRVRGIGATFDGTRRTVSVHFVGQQKPINLITDFGRRNYFV